jgi:hypothetical protein
MQLHLVLLVTAFPAVVLADFASPSARRGRQESNAIQGSSVDFSQATFDEESGKMCVIKEEEIESLEKTPVLECTHKNVEKCHYTYITEFTPSQEEVCDESFEKTCQITFKKQVVKEVINKCYMPLVSVCNGQGKDICKTLYESSCSTKYIEKQPGKFVGDTRCEKLPIEVCGAGCVVEEGPEECHEKELTNLIDVPEEVCDLNPQKTCRLQTRLVPSLKPQHECTIIPQEVCNLKFTSPTLKKKPLLTKWCLDDTPSPPDETYDEINARAEPISAASSYQPQYQPSEPQYQPEFRSDFQPQFQDDFQQNFQTDYSRNKRQRQRQKQQHWRNKKSQNKQQQQGRRKTTLSKDSTQLAGYRASSLLTQLRV